jgi:hypothetical protein
MHSNKYTPSGQGMSATAILCVARNESPYTAEWLEYHFSIGIDRIYYVSTDSDFARIKAFIDGSQFRSRIELLHFQDFRPGWQARCYNVQLPLISEDWVLVIDIDEFLYLNTFPNMTAFLDRVGTDIGQIQFPWLNFISANYHETRVFDILSHSDPYISDHVKSMARRTNITRLGIHSHGVQGLKNCLSSGLELPAKSKHGALFAEPEYHQKYPFIMHFVSRGHLDVLNRIVDHQFFTAKNGQAERDRLSSFLTGTANWSNIPNRYLLMKFLSSLPTANVQFDLPDISSRTDPQDLERIFLRNIKRIVDFEDHGDTLLTSQFENRYRLSQKLSTLELPGICKLEDYLECASQLQYIRKLRRLIISAQP